ncbi:MAG: hypothetical protein ACK4MF_03800 [Hyphomicrobiaceae bacterium]
MRRPRRDHGGSEVALMAVITKAMGAFLVLVVIMLPHYVYAPASTENARRANEQIQQAREAAQQIADKLKAGRLTDAELDDLLRQIEQLQTSLTAANNEIAALKRSLDQAHSEIERQKKTIETQTQRIAELDAELRRLTEEVERLRAAKTDKGALVATLTWQDCPGADFEIFIETDATADGKPFAGVNRQNQTSYWIDGHSYSGMSTFASWRSGSITSIRPGTSVPERLLFWVKLRNPLPFGDKDDRSCNVFGNLMSTKASRAAANRIKVGDQAPIALLMQVAKDARGETLTPEAPSAALLEARLSALASSPCSGLLCFAGTPTGSQVREDELKAAFVTYATDTFEISRDAAIELFSLVAERALSVGETYQWLGAFPKKGVKEGAKDDGWLAPFLRQLDNIGAPGRVRAELSRMLTNGEASPLYVAESLTGLTGREQLDAKFAARLIRRSSQALGKAVREDVITGADRAALEGLWFLELSVRAGGHGSGGVAAKPLAADGVEAALARTTLPEQLRDIIRHIALSGFVSRPLSDWEATLARFEKKPRTEPGKSPPP